MRLSKTRRQRPTTRRPARRQAFTLVEMSVALGVFGFVTVGLIYTLLFAARCDELVNSKLGASDSSRRGFDQLTSDIRAAKLWQIGSGNEDGFTACGNATNQIGNALQICFTTDTNSYVRYFFNTNAANDSACWLCRQPSGAANYSIIARNLTNVTGNSMTFHAERYDGTLAQDLEYKYVIVTTMEFCQYQYPLTKVGPHFFYNYYRMQFKAASHCPN